MSPLASWALLFVVWFALAALLLGCVGVGTREDYPTPPDDAGDDLTRRIDRRTG